MIGEWDERSDPVAAGSEWPSEGLRRSSLSDPQGLQCKDGRSELIGQHDSYHMVDLGSRVDVYVPEQFSDSITPMSATPRPTFSPEFPATTSLPLLPSPPRMDIWTYLAPIFGRWTSASGSLIIDRSEIRPPRVQLPNSSMARTDHPQAVASGTNEPHTMIAEAPEVTVSPAASRSRSVLGVFKYIVDWYPNSYSALERRTVFKLDCFLLPICGIMCKCPQILPIYPH
jgi:hypothetical protein